jgi:hypothetical protein
MAAFIAGTAKTTISKYYLDRTQVFMAASKKILLACCALFFGRYRRFGGACCFHHQGDEFLP